MAEFKSLLEKLVSIYGSGRDDGLYPTIGQWERLLKQPSDNVLVTTQFAKFKPDFHSPETQSAAAAYSQASSRLMQTLGIEVIYEGVYGSVLYGHDRDDWDFLGMLRFPNRAKFLDLFLHSDYVAVHKARDLMMVRYKMLISYPPFAHPVPWKAAAG